jgi:type IV pilus assembly protein PilM
MFRAGKKGWIGIEWGTQSLKVAQLERAKGSLRIAASAVVSRKPNQSQSPDLLSFFPAWSAEDVQTAVASDEHFTGRLAACVLPMHLTDLRALTIPPGTAAEQRAMIANELESSQTEAGEEVEFDYWQSPSANTSAATLSVNALSAPRKIVDRVARTLSEAGLVCQAIDGLPLVLSRAAILAHGLPCEPVAVLDWGYASSTFCVVSGDGPIFTRHLRNCSFAKLLETIGQMLCLPEEDVLEILAKYGLPGGAPDDKIAGQLQSVASELAEPILHEIVEELRRTVDYLKVQHPEIALERFCLTGDGAAVRHVDHFLAQRIGLPVDLWGLPVAMEGDVRRQLNDAARLGPAAALSALAWTSGQETI